MKIWDEIDRPAGDRGLRFRTELPSNFIGIHKFIAAIIFISFIASIILLLAALRQSQENSFQRFINNHKAGVYQGVTLSPLSGCSRCHKPNNAHDFIGGWLIAGAGDEGVRVVMEKKH